MRDYKIKNNMPHEIQCWTNTEKGKRVHRI